jgi:hypothetical protein
VKEFKNSLDDVDNVICRFIAKGTILVMGDYITEIPTRQESSFHFDKRGNLLVDLMIRSQLIVIEGSELSSGAMYSNVPYNSDRETLIDHILVQADKLNYIESCYIIDDDSLTVLTHRPIICTMCAYLLCYTGKKNP